MDYRGMRVVDSDAHYLEGPAVERFPVEADGEDLYVILPGG